MGFHFSKEYEAELIARADYVVPSMVSPMGDVGLTKMDAPSGPADGEWHKSPVKGIGWGPWTFRIPNWAPTPVNKLYDHHWASRRKHKQSDGEIVAHYGRGVPQAVRKRSVSLHVVFPPGKRMPDVDAYAKSLLDSLVHCGILVNDSSAWCVLEPVGYSRGQELVSFVTVEDV